VLHKVIVLIARFLYIGTSFGALLSESFFCIAGYVFRFVDVYTFAARNAHFRHTKTLGTSPN